MKVLVAGKGFIGERIGESLEHDVEYLSRSSGDIEQDITEGFELEKDFDVLIHTIGLEPGRYNREEYEKVHVDGTENLLEAIEPEKTVYISALGVEDGKHPYMQTKKQAEELVKDRSAYTVLRPSIVFGKENTALKRIADKFPFLVFPKISVRMQPIHIDDLVDIAVNSVESYDNQTLELGGPEVMPIYEMFRRYYRQTGRIFVGVPCPDFVPFYGLKMVSMLPIQSPSFSRQNLELLSDNVVDGENDAEKVLDELKRI